MPYRVEVTARASQDLDSIYRFIQAAESHHAAAWFNGLHSTLHSLGDMPQRGPEIRESSSRRHLLYGNKPHIYRVIYFINEDKKL
jgi:toxin ParE1/3/4